MSPDPVSRERVTGAILAGGAARRMQGVDKGLVMLAGKPMVQHVLERLRPQTATVIINANRSLDRYAAFGCPVISDAMAGYQGPLAGMAGCLAAAATDFIVTAPCDAPALPDDLVPRLAAALYAKGTSISAAHSGERLQPVFCMLHRDLLDSLREFLGRGERKIDRWFEEQGYAVADFSDVPEAFVNVNTPGDAADLEGRLAGGV